MTEYETVEDELAALDIQVEEALKGLRTERQRKFALAYSDGETGRKSMIDAGYEEKSADKNLGQIKGSKGMQRVLPLLRRQHALAHGIDPAWKRKMLTNIAETASSLGEGYQPTAAVRATEILCKMDGDVVQAQSQGNTGGVQIIIQTGIPERVGTVIEAKVIPDES